MISSLLKKVLLFMIRVYQVCISPLLGANCRFHPTCSAYAQQALEKHGVIKGLFLTFCRLGRCHPWSPGGYDPVPDAPKKSQTTCKHSH